MPQIQIQLLHGPLSGRRTTHDKARLTFGRLPGCDIVVDHPNVSREHGRLVYEDGQWHVENASPNGTAVNGRRIRDRRALADGDAIGVGKDALFAVHPIGAGQAAPADSNDPDERSPYAAAPQRDPAEVQAEIERRKRVRLWAIIGVYAVVVIVGGAVISQVLVGDKNGAHRAMPRQLTADQIEDDITALPQLAIDERQARDRLAEARGLYSRRQQSPRTLYEAFAAYKEALVLSGQKEFDDGLVQLEYKTAEEELIEQVTRAYNEAYALVGSRQWHDAERALRRIVQETYPAKNTRVFANVNRLITYVRQRTKD